MRLGRTTVKNICAWAGFVCLSTVLATPISAQSTTEDGIRAVLRGEYQTAARILRPLAGDPARPDPVAQFFFAVLYASGQGVPEDALRACILFAGSATRKHPFSAQAAASATRLRAGFLGFPSCVADSWQNGPPQSFLLESGHRVVITETSITVSHGDEEHRTTHLVPRDAVLLPIRHIPLVVTRPIGKRRDFFQWFWWTPDRKVNPSSWTLDWILCEIASGGGVWFTGESNLLVTRGPRPPASSDVSNFVRLRVNAKGEAEFTITGGASPRTQVIPWQGKQ
jgi:hypothetical protein